MILLILSILFNTYSPSVYAHENTTYYARILFDQVYLYKSPTNDDSFSNIYFELPKTYFVELLDKSGDFYEARYLDFVGYVKKDSVQAILGTPQNPFLTSISFRVFADLSQDLRSCPTTQTSTSNLLIQIPNLTKNIQYFGKIKGECLIEGRTDIWYYCKYTADKEYFGYVYSDFCDEKQEITSNKEEFEYISNPTFETITPPTKSIPITSNTVGIIVAILSVPALAFVLLIMRGTRIMSKEKYKGKEIIDY